MCQTQHRIAPIYTTLHHTTPHHSTPHHITPHHTTSHHTKPHHTTPNQTTPHYTTPHYQEHSLISTASGSLTCNVIDISFRWFATKIGKCSTLCGEGIQYQQVRCIWIYGPRFERWESVSDSRCKHVKKPPNSIPCKGACETHWTYSDWSQVKIKMKFRKRLEC